MSIRTLRGAVSRLLKGLLVAALVLLSSSTNALRNGISGYSGKGGDSCSDNCHAGGTEPEVVLVGPNGAATEALVSFAISVTSNNPRQFVAGFDVAANGGILEPIDDQGERHEGAELTHTAPKQAIDDVATWLFHWRTPAQEGHYRIFGSGLSANGTGSRLGDASATATIDIFVRSAQHFADANCDSRLSAADPTSLIRGIGLPADGSCAFADIDGDGQVEDNDLQGLVVALFE
jgi:hypothetical protein